MKLVHSAETGTPKSLFTKTPKYLPNCWKQELPNSFINIIFVFYPFLCRPSRVVFFGWCVLLIFRDGPSRGCQIRICLIMEDVTSRDTCSLRFTQSQIWQIGLNFERKLAFVATKFPQKVRVKEITNRSRKGIRLPNLIKYHCPLQLHFIIHFCIIN